jgi:hypothetical protein
MFSQQHEDPYSNPATQGYTYNVWAAGSAAVNRTYTAFGQTFQACSSSLRAMSFNVATSPLDNAAQLTITVWQPNGTNLKGTQVSAAPCVTPIANYGETRCVFSDATGMTLVPGSIYYVEARPVGTSSSLVAYFDPTDPYPAADGNGVRNTALKAYQGLTPVPVQGTDFDLNIRLESDGTWGESAAWDERQVGIYVARYTLNQLKEHVGGAIVFKHGDACGIDTWGLVKFCDAGQPLRSSGKALQNLWTLMKTAFNEPSFDVDVPSGVDVVTRIDRANHTLVIALWRPLGAAYAHPLTGQRVVIHDTAYAGVGTTFADVSSVPMTMLPFTTTTCATGTTCVDGLTISESPIVLVIPST